MSEAPPKDAPPRWRIVCRAPSGNIAPGRLAQIFCDGRELHHILDISVHMPIDGVAFVRLEALAEDIEVEGDFAHILRRVEATSLSGEHRGGQLVFTDAETDQPMAVPLVRVVQLTPADSLIQGAETRIDVRAEDGDRASYYARESVRTLSRRN